MKALLTFFFNPFKLKLKHSLGAYDNKNKCAKSPRDHFIDPQTQATSFCMENDHEKIELLNYDTSIHGKSTIRKDMVPWVQKCPFFVSIVSYAEKI